MSSKKSLPPILARPMRRPDDPITGLYLLREWIKRLRTLLEHYDIDDADPNKWLTLLLKLAVDHVPGFQIEQAARRRGGRPRKRAISLSKSRSIQRRLNREGWYRGILHLREIGERELVTRNLRVTNKAALETGLKRMYSEFGVPMSDREIRNQAASMAKRLSEAKKFLRDSAKT